MTTALHADVRAATRKPRVNVSHHKSQVHRALPLPVLGRGVHARCSPSRRETGRGRLRKNEAGKAVRVSRRAQATTPRLSCAETNDNRITDVRINIIRTRIMHGRSSAASARKIATRLFTHIPEYPHPGLEPGPRPNSLLFLRTNSTTKLSVFDAARRAPAVDACSFTWSARGDTFRQAKAASTPTRPARPRPPLAQSAATDATRGRAALELGASVGCKPQNLSCAARQT